MEVRVAQAALREGVQVRGVDLRAVAAEVREPEVVAQHDHDVGLALRARARRPPRLRAGDGATDLALETLVRLRHAAQRIASDACRLLCPATCPTRSSAVA